MNKSTPGPWIHDQPENMIVVEMEDGTQRLIAQARSVHFSKEVRDANARLIAAAPELLDALKLIADQSSEGSGSTGTAGWFGAIARVAIEKATGAA